MEQLTLIGIVILAHLVGLISPGPDFIMAVKNSLSYSRKTGIWTAIGFSLGVAVHIIYCVAGLALIISQSILIFNIIKFLGAGYLIYIGLKSILSESSKINISKQTKKTDISPFSAIKMGFLTTVLNPKVTLFFLSLFTFVLSPETPTAILVTVSVIMMFNTALWFSLVAIFFTQKSVRSVFDKFQGVFNKIFGTLLIALGAKVAMTSR